MTDHKDPPLNDNPPPVRDFIAEAQKVTAPQAKEDDVLPPACHVPGDGHAIETQAPEAKDAGIYTCPMHPEVREPKAGICPKCGMALEPAVATAEETGDAELADMQDRFWGALFLTAPVVALEMTRHITSVTHLLSPLVITRIELLGATPVVLWAGWPFFQRGCASLRSGNLNMFTLISLGAGTAWLYSAIAAVRPGIFPAAFHQADGSVMAYFEAASVITVFVLLGQVLELRALRKTGDAIRSLLKLTPKTARRVSGGEAAEADVPVESIAVGDLLRVRPGERIPVDGTLTEGASTVDESTMTGEAAPVSKSIGAAVTGGTLNQSGGFVMRAEKVGDGTALAQIVRLVAEAQRSRAPIQSIADKVSAWFVPAVVTMAIIAFIYWAMFGPPPAYTFAVLSAVSVLIIACPCALGLATPMAIMEGIGRGAKAGVLIRNAETLERLGKVDTIVIDKTGTLTEGKPAVTAVVPAEDVEEARLLAVAGALERGSEHPLARAVQVAVTGKALPVVTNFQSLAGKGVTATLDGKPAALGNAGLMKDLDVVMTPALTAKAADLQKDGATVVFVSVDGHLSGLLGIADPIKPTSQAAVQALQAQGIRLVMVTGDNRVTAVAVAKKLGMTEVIAEVLPADKGRTVQQLKSMGRIVAMAGDGANDAPALALADVGIAMGTGTDIAIQSAGVTLVKGDLNGILRARKLSRATLNNIRQNLFFALVYNAAGVPVAAGILYPFFHILLSPMIAAGAMSLSSVCVILNALRLRWIKL